MSEDDPESQLVPAGHEALALTSLADNRILAEMVGASLTLAKDSAPASIGLDAMASLSFVTAQMTEKLGREPNDEELAEEIGRSVAEVSKLKTAVIRLVSFETLIIPQIYEDSPEYKCKLAAVDWYWRAAQLGHARAQFEIACRFHEGNFVR